MRELISLLNDADVDPARVEVVVAPPALHLQLARDLLRKNISVSAQNVSLTGLGAFTGEIAAEQLLGTIKLSMHIEGLLTLCQ